MRTDPVDFDLHGTVGIRLIDPTPGDAAAVRRQLGPIEGSLSRQPDIMLRFVDRLTFPSPIRYLGVDDAGFTEHAFLVLRGKHQARVKVQIPFDQIGKPQCEIICESGLPAVPLLIPILNLTMLSKGVLPLHASALLYHGEGILVTGWSKGGKTESLLAFIANGAEYVGDEWVYISNDGQTMHGVPEPIRVWYWHLQEMPQYKALVNRRDMMRLKILNLLVNFLERLEAGRGRPGSGAAALIRRSRALVQRQLNVQLPPDKLFGRKSGETAAPLQKVFLVASHSKPDLVVTRVSAEEIARRMVFSLQEERLDFMSYYWKYRFAFPECSNPLIDQVEEIERGMLLKVLADKDAFAVHHPYPFSIPKLFEAIRPHLA